MGLKSEHKDLMFAVIEEGCKEWGDLVKGMG